MKQFQRWLPLAVLLVVAVVVCLLTSATPETETRPIDCPYPTQTCPYASGQITDDSLEGCHNPKEHQKCSDPFSVTAYL